LGILSEFHYFYSIVSLYPKSMAVYNFKSTKIYRKSFDLAMEIFEVSKSFPSAEKYSLVDQIRRSSRSVCTNLAEAYRKKQYPANFISKLSDCDAENSETNVWLDIAHACDYIDRDLHQNLVSKNEEIGKLLHHMITNPDKY
jgi:four helix bundle protein